MYWELTKVTYQHHTNTPHHNYSANYNYTSARVLINYYVLVVGPINCMQSDNSVIVSGSQDHSAKVWALDTGECLDTLEGHSNLSNHGVSAVAVNSSFIVSASTSLIKLWNRDSRTLIHNFDQNVNGEVLALSMFTHGGNTFLASGAEFSVLLWNLDVRDAMFLGERNEMLGHSRMVRCLAFQDTSNNRLLSGSNDSTVRLWDLHTGRNLMTLLGHKAAVTSVKIDDSMVITASSDSTIRFYDVRIRKCLETVQSWAGPIQDLQYNDYHIISAHNNGSITHWDIRYTKWFQQSFVAHGNKVTSIQLYNSKLLSSSNDHTIKYWDFSGEDIAATGQQQSLLSLSTRSHIHTLYTGHADSNNSVERGGDHNHLVPFNHVRNNNNHNNNNNSDSIVCTIS